MNRYGIITGIGHYLPDKEIKNSDLKKELEQVSPALPPVVDKLEESSGIKSRRHAPREWTTSDLALEAAKAAMADAGIKPGDIDMILLGTDTPDYITPATSVVLQYKLGATNAGTYDIGCACASFPAGVATAAGMLATNPWMKNILVVGAYMMSKLADPNDVMKFFYGDGAGAVIMSASNAPGFITSAYLADGSYHKNWGIYSGGTYEPATEESVREGRTRVKLIEKFPPEVNHQGWPRLVRYLSERGGFILSDIDMAIFTQVRLPSIKLVMDDLGIPIEKTHWIMEDWGYTGSACIPMCLSDAKNRLASNNLLVLVGSGVGYNQAAVALRMP